MSDVSSRISGILLKPKMPTGQSCDFCDEPASQRIQGETDSFGCEWLDFCDHHAERVRAGATFGYCVECEVLFELTDPDVEMPRCPVHETGRGEG